MNQTQPATPPWYKRAPVRNLTVVASLALATLAVVLAFDHANPAPAEARPTAGPFPYVEQLGAGIAQEYGAAAANNVPSAADRTPIGSGREPLVPALSFVPNAADAQEPRAPTF